MEAGIAALAADLRQPVGWDQEEAPLSCLRARVMHINGLREHEFESGLPGLGLVWYPGILVRLSADSMHKMLQPSVFGSGRPS